MLSFCFLVHKMQMEKYKWMHSSFKMQLEVLVFLSFFAECTVISRWKSILCLKKQEGQRSLCECHKALSLLLYFLKAFCSCIDEWPIHQKFSIAAKNQHTSISEALWGGDVIVAVLDSDHIILLWCVRKTEIVYGFG